MHIIREEMEEEADDDESNAGMNQEQQPSAGGLSRAFKPTFGTSRALSLHNLLDQCLVDEALASSQHGDSSYYGRLAAGLVDKDQSAVGERKGKQQSAGTWDRKQEVRLLSPLLF